MLGFSALSSAAISSQVGLPVAIQATVSTATTVNANLTLTNNPAASLTTTAVVAPKLTLTNNAAASLSVSATVAATLSLSKNLSLSANVAATVNPNLVLDNNAAASLATTAVVAPNLKLTNNAAASLSVSGTTAAATLSLSKNLSLSANTAVTVAPNLTLVNNAAASLSVSAVTSPATIAITKNLSASVSTAVTVNPILGRVQNLSSNLSSTVNVNPNLTLVNNLAASIVGTNILATALNVDKLLQAQLSTTATVAPNLKLVNNAASSVTTTVSTSSTLALSKNLSSSLSVNANTSATLFVANNISAAASATATTAPNLTLEQPLSGNVTALATASPNLTLTHLLQGNLQTDSDIMVGIPVNASVSVQSNVFALLDIDGNTEGSPGGIPVEGFYPPSSVILANHSESAAAATYTITADIEPGYTTEIVQAYTDINPNNVIQLSYANNIVSVYLNTPLEVYGMSSTFTVSRDVVPQFDVAFNYNLQLNTTVTNSSNGNNFRSNKFYIYGNESPCFLRDDGAGFITLFEEPEPGLIRKLRDTGKIDYVKGELSVESLRITGLVDAFLQFSATSLNTIVPTTDYFNEKNSLLVQAKTVAFPTGEAVEIYQYTKAEELIDVYITVVARAYNPLAPEITVDQREAVYKLTVLPDYNLGKDKLQQLLQAA